MKVKSPRCNPNVRRERRDDDGFNYIDDINTKSNTSVATKSKTKLKVIQPYCSQSGSAQRRKNQSITSSSDTPSLAGTLDSITSTGQRFQMLKMGFRSSIGVTKQTGKTEVNDKRNSKKRQDHNTVQISESSTSLSLSDNDEDDDDTYTIEDEDDETYEEGTDEDEDTTDGTLETYETNEKENEDHWTLGIGNILSERTVQIKTKLAFEIDKLKNSKEIHTLPQQFGQKIAHVLTVVRETDDCGSISNDSDYYSQNEKEHSKDQKVKSILKNDIDRKFHGNSQISHHSHTEESESMSTSFGPSTFQADWLQCEKECEATKDTRELKSAQDEIVLLRNNLKDALKQKQNVESQLEFAKLALKSLSDSPSGNFCQIANARGAFEIFDGDMGTSPKPKVLRRPLQIFQRRKYI
jgi:hypothetical protein